MKRASLKVAALSAAVLVGTMASTSTPTAALPEPAQGGPAELLRFVGDPSSATGAAISNGPCDVNGDGYDDVVVGAWFWDKAPTQNIGATYVIFGGPDVQGASLADPAEAGAVRIDGPATASAFTGFAVGCIGDVNGDDLDDIAISHYTAQKAYVVFGAEEFTGLTLDSMGDRGFSVVGGPAFGNLGFSLAAVGDLNADGLDDFGVAEVAGDYQGRVNNGRVWVIAGRDDITDVDLTAPTAGQVLLTVDGAIAEERIGNISRVGDVNGDGVDDFLLGAYTSTPWGSGVAVPGAAYVVFGGNTGEIDAANLGTKGFSIVGPTRQRDRLGISVSGLGDLNGDGLADLLIGADGVNNATTGPRNGGAAVVFGSASLDRVYTDPAATSGQSVFTCAGLSGDPSTCASPVRRGYWLDGAVNSDSTGYSVAGLGDVNGDDLPDLALGAYGFDPANPAGGTFSGAGATYVVFGDPAATTVALGSLAADKGYRIDGTAAGDRFGRQVGAIGDLDDNGTPDFVVGADFAARPSAQQGELTVALMGQLDTELLLEGPAEVTTGDAATYTATVDKLAGAPAPVAAGTVDFSFGGSPIASCQDVAVAAGAASCTATWNAEATGDVVATYSGTATLKAATSNAIATSVEQVATTTTLDVSDDSPQTGQVVQLVAAVTDADGAVASGTVRFTTNGTPISGCGAVALLGDGSASCTTSWKALGSSDVVATYSGTVRHAASTSATTIVNVGANVAIYTRDAVGTFGSKGAVIQGVVLGEARTATGTVTVRNGATVLGTGTLTNGWFSIPVGATALYPRHTSVTVDYAGDARHRPASATAAVAISKATPKVTAVVTPTTMTAGVTKGTIAVTVSATGTVPQGTVKVQLDGRTLATTATLDASGKATITLPVMGVKGTRSIRVQFAGSTTVGVGLSTATTITVR